MMVKTVIGRDIANQNSNSHTSMGFNCQQKLTKNLKLNSVALVCEQTIPTCVVSAMDRHCYIISFLDGAANISCK
jgi:hypothetical protein